jgi:hypothetical protein
MKKVAVVSVYMALFLCAVTTCRKLVLAEYRIGYFHYGYSLIEALVLAKVIVFGSVFRLGERFGDRPLIVPTLYKTLCFGVLVLVFSVLEHLIDGWLHSETAGAAVDAILRQSQWAMLASLLVMILAFVPMFAVWETGRVLGEGKLFELFFKRRTRVKLDTTAD